MRTYIHVSISLCLALCTYVLEQENEKECHARPRRPKQSPCDPEEVTDLSSSECLDAPCPTTSCTDWGQEPSVYRDEVPGVNLLVARFQDWRCGTADGRCITQSLSSLS